MESAAHYSAALAILGSALAVYAVFQRENALRHVVGPPSSSWVFGHMRELVLSMRYGDYEFAWQKLYGSVYRLRGCFGQERLMVSDPVAVQYLLNSPSFRRSPILEGMANLLLGGSSVMLTTDSGDEHRRLRAALNVGFTAAAVRNYQPVFQKVAGMISDKFEESAGASTNVCPLLSTATLAAISEGGDQSVLGSSLEELGEDFVANNLTSQSEGQVLGDAIAAHLPLWFWRLAMYFPTTPSKIVRKARSLAYRIGHRIVREKVDAAAKGLEINNDVFGLLLDPDNPDSTKKLSEEDLAAQTGVILLAGQETTAIAVAFGLLELARDLELQDKLRVEVNVALAGGTGNVIYDNMPLLNALIKEILRQYPVGPLSDRVAIEDAVIPLSEAITTSTGERMSQVPVKKGQLVTMAVASYQRLTSRWGKDADKFNPYRWLDGRTYQGDAVGPYANLLSFNGGPRICLGWRFAILEMQVILCEVIAKFSFAEPGNEHVRVKYLNNNLLPIASSGDRALPLCITRLL
ncbi:cytochrome P450 [Mycena capillaripes]|nr:cytochrome P450 [Mycena capillaripes]